MLRRFGVSLVGGVHGVADDFEHVVDGEDCNKIGVQITVCVKQSKSKLTDAM